MFQLQDPNCYAQLGTSSDTDSFDSRLDVRTLQRRRCCEMQSGNLGHLCRTDLVELSSTVPRRYDWQPGSAFENVCGCRDSHPPRQGGIQ